MAGFPYSSTVTAGTNAVASANNDQRKDAMTRWFKFEVIGTLITGNKQGGSFIVPYLGTVVSTRLKTTSGSATVRVQKDGVDVDNAMSATSTVSTDSTPVSAAITSGQLLTMDITAVSSGVDLVVEVEILAT